MKFSLLLFSILFSFSFFIIHEKEDCDMEKSFTKVENLNQTKGCCLANKEMNCCEKDKEKNNKDCSTHCNDIICHTPQVLVYASYNNELQIQHPKKIKEKTKKWVYTMHNTLHPYFSIWHPPKIS